MVNEQEPLMMQRSPGPGLTQEVVVKCHSVYKYLEKIYTWQPNQSSHNRMDTKSFRTTRRRRAWSRMRWSAGGRAGLLHGYSRAGLGVALGEGRALLVDLLGGGLWALLDRRPGERFLGGSGGSFLGPSLRLVVDFFVASETVTAGLAAGRRLGLLHVRLVGRVAAALPPAELRGFGPRRRGLPWKGERK